MGFFFLVTTFYYASFNVLAYKKRKIFKLIVLKYEYLFGLLRKAQFLRNPMNIIDKGQFLDHNSI